MNRITSVFCFLAVAFCAALFTPSTCLATTYYVATTGSDSNPGTQTKPFLTIQKGVNTANTGDTVLIADGTYTGAKNRNVDFGGVDLIIHSMSGNPAKCIVDCQQAGCAFILQNNQTASSNIAGFTIKNGTGFNGSGGGIYISQNDTNPVVNSCVFTVNSADSLGGGMYYGTATNCTFIGNSTVGQFNEGGAMYGSTAINCAFTNNSAIYGNGGGMAYGIATNCTFINNSAPDGDDGTGHGSGGAIYSVIATNCTFTGNSSTDNTSGGGAMSYGTATNCTFTNNSAFDGGGAIYDGTATNCTFTGNSAYYGGGMAKGTANNCVFVGNSIYSDGDGGGMSSGTATNCMFIDNLASCGGGASEGTAINCVFIGNSASVSGGGVYSSNLYFCTAANNYATASGGGVYLSSNTVTNCIVWGNTVGGSSPNITGTGTVMYSDIQRGFTGTGNINSDPLFVNSTSGDLHLMAGSPCINVGTTTVLLVSHFPPPTLTAESARLARSRTWARMKLAMSAFPARLLSQASLPTPSRKTFPYSSVWSAAARQSTKRTPPLPMARFISMAFLTVFTISG